MSAMAGAVTGTNLKSARRSVRGARDSGANRRLGAITGDPLAKAAVTEPTGLRRTSFPSCVSFTPQSEFAAAARCCEIRKRTPGSPDRRAFQANWHGKAGARELHRALCRTEV